MLQTGPRCAARPASCQGGACHLGATLSHSESAVHRVHETLSGSREQRLAWSKSTQSLLCLLQGKTVLLSVGYYPPSALPAYIRVSFLINVKILFFLLIKNPSPPVHSRSGIIQMSCMKLCRRRIRQTSRTWTWMTSLQPVTPGALHQVQASSPK